MGASVNPRADDRALILDVWARYSTSIDGRDLAALRTCFADDAVAGYWPGHQLDGADEIVAFIGGSIGSFRATQHLIGTHSFEFEDDDTARASTYVQAAHVMDRGGREVVVVVGGRYVDRLRREPDGWKLVERRFEPMWTTEAASSVMPAPGQNESRQ